MPSDVPMLPDIKSWVNLKLLGAVGNGIADDTDILEKAIAEHRTVYLPSGHYRVTRPIVLKEHTVLVGLSPVSTQIVITDSTQAYQGVGTPVPLLETPKGGDNIVTGIGLAVTGVNPRAVAAKWMAGTESMMNDVKFFENPRTYIKGGFAPAYNSTVSPDERQFRKWDTQYWSLWITNGGGGTFKDIWISEPYSCAGMYISETSTEGRLYMMSVEHHVRHEVIIDKVSNWKFFAIQLEEEHPHSPYCLPIYIRNSHDLFFANTFSYRVSRMINPYPYMIKTENSKNITFKGIHNCSATKYPFENTLFEQTSDTILRSREIAFFKIPEKIDFQKPVYKVEKLAGGFEYIDGITSDSRGNIYFIDSRKQHIYRWGTDNKLLLVSNFPIYPACLACDKNDHLMVVTRFVHPSSIFNTGTIGAVGFDPEHPESTIHSLKEVALDKISGKTVFHQTGRYDDNNLPFRITRKINSGYISSDGTTVIPITHDIGRTWSLKKAVPGQVFYTTTRSGFKTYKCNVETDGSLANPLLFAETGAYDAVSDSEGKVYVPADNILVYDRDGKLIDMIEVPERPSTIIFGGTNNDILFICAGTSLYCYKPQY
jgi:Gluconolactonase